MKDKTILTVGKRKTSVARAAVYPGTGKVRVNKTPLENLGSQVLRMKILEALKICKPHSDSYDFEVSVMGGGMNGQTDAVRQAIVKGIVEAVKDKSLRQRVMAYDRNLLVYDPRRTEVHKPSRSSKGARRKRQMSKR